MQVLAVFHYIPNIICLFFCALVCELLFYIMCIELQICKNTVTGGLVPFILAILRPKYVYISSTLVTQRNTIIPILSAKSVQLSSMTSYLFSKMEIK